jgi:hypothetical protein
MTEVLINGVRYVPAENLPDEVRVYYMHDNHTFTRLLGATLDDILAHADDVESTPGGSCGMLCPAVLLGNGKKIRRVGPYAHAGGFKDPKDEWREGKAKWLKAMEADPDIMRLMVHSDRTEEDSHCLADDPDAMCAACDCWKKTREFCG